MTDCNFRVEKAGRVFMQTQDPRCIYDAETCKAMKAAGYRVTLNGRVYPPKERKQQWTGFVDF